MADKPRCIERVYTGARRDWGGHQCSKSGVVQVGGKWYCGIHDPEKVEQRREASRAKWAAESKAAERQCQIKRLKEEVVAAAKEWSDHGINGSSYSVNLLNKVLELIAAERESE